MTDVPDAELLAQFTDENSGPAFATLVERHIGLVHSVALRHTTNPHHAQDITQAVFIILARKASSLSRRTILPGWLYHTARLTAANFQRAESRRIRREQEVYMQSILNENGAAAPWPEMAPLLDEAMSHLGAADRDALVLRYFKNKNLSDVGAAMGLQERAAQKRVIRALEKLRIYFSRRGVVLTAAMLASALAANAVQAAPATMAKTISVVAAAKGVTAGASTLMLVKGALNLMAWAKVKFAGLTIAAVLIAAGITTVGVHSYFDVSSPQWSVKFRTGEVPPTFMIRPTDGSITGGGASGNFGKSNSLVIMGGNLTLDFMLADAYGIEGRCIIFHANLPKEHFDYLVTEQEHPREKLQAEIAKRFGLSGRRVMIETNVLTLRLGDSGAGKLKISPWPKAITPNTHDRSRFLELSTQPLSTLRSVLENELDRLVVDQTGQTNFFDILLEWHRQPRNLEAGRTSLKQALHDQLGLELVSTNMPVEMLVVEKLE